MSSGRCIRPSVRAREALSVVLRVVALAVAPSIVNMVNEHEDSGDDFILIG